MHFFGDFEAINNHIVAAAFVSADGQQEEHWLMKPFPQFRRIEGVYAQLLPYRNRDLLAAPLLRDSGLRFQNIIAQAEKLWFFDRGDLKFFHDSFPDESDMLLDFSERYADAKPLVEEILTPIYIRNLNDGRMVNIRNIVPYLEQENLNSKQEKELHQQLQIHLSRLQHLIDSSADRLERIVKQASENEPGREESLNSAYLQDFLARAKQNLHPQTLFPREIIKELRWLRTRLARLQFSAVEQPRLIVRMLCAIDAMLTIQGKRLTASKVSVSALEELIQEQHLPLQVVELFKEAELDRDQCLEYLGRGIGLQSAAAMLLDEEQLALEGDEHNALYDSRLLRLVGLNCFARLKKLAPYLGP